MLQQLFTNPISFLIWLIALLVAITIHEFAHAFVADHLGDPTPRVNGRLTLDPRAHLDPLGTLTLLLFRLGWGKPVPIDPYNLENPRRDSALISLAGPASNLVLAAILSLILKISPIMAFFNFLIAPLIILNVSLGVFNLLPVPPLDGSKILTGFLPRTLSFQIEEIFSEYGFVLLILLLFPFAGSSLASQIIFPIINFVLSFLL